LKRRYTRKSWRKLYINEFKKFVISRSDYSGAEDCRETDRGAFCLQFDQDYDNIADINMEINELKKMLKNSTAVLIVENGEPSVVVVDYATYKRMSDNEFSQEGLNGAVVGSMTHVGAELQNRTGPDPEILEKINNEILALKTEIENEEKKMAID
jgi:prevent-host-death family protein